MTNNAFLRIIDGKEYFISDNVYFVVYEYDVRWFEVKKNVEGGTTKRMVMELNTYPTNPLVFIGYLSWKHKLTI